MEEATHIELSAKKKVSGDENSINIPIKQGGIVGKVYKLLEILLLPDSEVNKVACYRVFRSKQGIQNEKDRQLRDHPWIIHPFSIFRWYWDLILFVTLMITLLTLPFELAFYTTLTNEGESPSAAIWEALHAASDLIFVLDLLLNFRTAYVQKETETVIMKQKDICINYFKTWFAVDLISMDPISVLHLWPEDSVAVHTTALFRLVKLLKMLRILRVARFLRTLHKIEEVLQVDANAISMFNMILSMLMFAHWSGCLQFFGAYIEHYPDFPDNSWVIWDNLTAPGTSVFIRYTRSVFRSMSHMIGIGFGLRPPETPGETWMTLCSMGLGATFFALFIGHMSTLIMTMDTSGKRYEEKMSEVKQYLRFRRVPLPLQKKAFDYFEHKYQRKYFEEATLFEESMSYQMKREIQLHNKKNLVQSVPFLSEGSMEFLFEIICKLAHQIFFIGDVIMQEGKTADRMYFLEHGQVEVEANGQHVSTLTDGAYFGEMALMLDALRSATVTVSETCDVYLLMRADFNEVLDNHPNMKESMKKVAEERKRELSARDQSVAVLPKVIVEEHIDLNEHVVNVNNSNDKKND